MFELLIFGVRNETGETMKSVSALLRIVCGIGVIGVSGYVYLTTGKQAEKIGAGDVTLYNKPFNISPDTLQWLILGAGVVGVLLLIYGVMTFAKESAEASGDEE
ncbi:MAG: hypothetical protein ACKO85_18030 [Isosphaeraceae bacterium]